MELSHILVIAAFVLIGTAGMIALQDAVSRMASFWLDAFRRQSAPARPSLNFIRTSRSV